MIKKNYPKSNLPIRRTVDLLPSVFRSISNKKFLAGTLDALTQPGVLSKTIGYVGRKYGKTYNASDVYIDNDESTRSFYQLEPGVITTSADEVISNVYDIIDLKSQIKFFGNSVMRDDISYNQEMYTWNPPINWDKFVNYRQYFWIDPTNGPKDYIVMTADEFGNAWQQSNHWVHVDDITDLNFNYDETKRAKRPIIEFDATLTLFSGQVKSTINQAPLFDAFDSNGNSYSNTSIYPASTFSGSKLFGYSVSTGINDTELGFPIKYQTVNNSGDIQFTWFFDSDNFSYLQNQLTVTEHIRNGFFEKDSVKENGWIALNNEFLGSVVDSVSIAVTTNSVSFSTFDWNSVDFSAVFYKNGVRINEDPVRSENNFTFLLTQFTAGDEVTIKVIANATPVTGNYEFPTALERNPLNSELSTLTLGEAADHLMSAFEFSDPQVAIRNELNFIQRSTRFVKHASLPALALATLCNKENNIVKSLRYANKVYSSFKTQFLQIAKRLPRFDNAAEAVDSIIAEYARSKSTQSPFAFSDMIGSGAYTETLIQVTNSAITTFNLSDSFDLTTPSTRAVYIYLNDQQLINGVDYTFDYNAGTVSVFVTLVVSDVLTIREYISTSASYIPPTPSSIGLYKKFKPEIFIDDTYATPVAVVRGHDGSITVGVDEYLNELLLELELRIYNNIKNSYDESVFNIDHVIGSEFTQSDVSPIVFRDFLRWNQIAGVDYTVNSYTVQNEPFTYNYSNASSSIINGPVPGYWKGIYLELFETIRPHTAPWEMLGFSEKPAWWENQYGTDYGSNNLLLWTDLRDGNIRQGDRAGTYERFARPNLLAYLPVDAAGSLLDPIAAGIISGVSQSYTLRSFEYGDVAPVEYAWRSSSEWPFAVMISLCLLKPLEFIGKLLNIDSTGVNNINQRVDTATSRFVTLSTVTKLQDYPVGLLSYIVDYAKSVGSNGNSVIDFINSLDVRLTLRAGGFVDETKQQFVLDSKVPYSSGVFVPAESYFIASVESSPIEALSYSGIVVEKLSNGWAVSGYNVSEPFIEIYQPIENKGDPIISVGGVSEEFVNWAENSSYINGQVAKYRDDFYRCVRSHASVDSFDLTFWVKLPSLPVVGNSTAIQRTKFKKNEVTIISYGTVLSSLQAVVDLLLGYESRLKDQGFVFDQYDPDNQVPLNWVTSCKEFLFWSRQNWEVGSIISLSPSALNITVNKSFGNLESLINNFDNYQILQVDRTPIPLSAIDVDRDLETISITTNNGTGIYFIKLSFTLNEHVVVFDDRTVFNDVIFDKSTGFRQERIKSRGFRTVDWTGSFNTPGFVYDSAEIRSWQPYVDYKIGDMVRYRSRVFTSLLNHKSNGEFNYSSWAVQSQAITKGLVPNFDFRIKQISEYFEVDADSIQLAQREQARHTIGYQARSYLEEIAEDSTTQYQLYQGFIRDKGIIGSISKVFGRLSRSTDDGVIINEEWAFRVGNLGGTDQLQEIEFIVEKDKLSNSQNILINEILPDVSISSKYVITPRSFTVSTDPFTVDVFPTTAEPVSLRVAGYVNVNDISLSLPNKQSLTSVDIDSLTPNDYIWFTFDKSSWSVHRLVESNVRIVNITVQGTTATLTFNREVSILPFDIIGIRNIPELHGFYEVMSVTGSSATITVPQGTLSFTGISKPLLLLENSRFDTFDSANPTSIAKLPAGSTLWVDNVDGKWEIVSKQPQFKDKIGNITRSLVNNTNRLGSNVAFSPARQQSYASVNSAVAGIIADPDNKARVLCLEERNNELVVVQTLAPTLFTETQFGLSIDVNESGLLMAISSLTGSKVYTYKYFDNRWTALDPITGIDPTEVSFGTIDGNDVLAIASAATSSVYIYSFDPNLESWSLDQTITEALISNFGEKVQLSKNGLILAVSSVDLTYRGLWSENRSYLQDDIVVYNGFIYRAIADTEEEPTAGSDWFEDSETNHLGSVRIYKFNGTSYAFLQEITSDSIGQLQTGSDQFGFDLAITYDASTLVISSPKVDNDYRDQGAAYVFSLSDTEYVLDQTLASFEDLLDENFGHSISISADGSTVVVGAKNAATRVDIFETEGTTFDSISTFIVDYDNFFGAVYVFDKKDSLYFLTEKLEPTILGLSERESFGFSVACSNNFIIVGSPDYTNPASGVIAGAYRPFMRDTTSSWIVKNQQTPLVDIKKIKAVSLIDNVNNFKISEVDIIDPAKGKIANVAEQEITFKTMYDPAVYSVGDNTTLQIVDESTSWAEKNVGKLWWDLSTVKWVYYEQDDSTYRSANWGALAVGSSVDVYEWVESRSTPEEWYNLSLTNEGRVLGFTGTPKYINNEFYSIRAVKNQQGNTVENIYYFWVKNKTTMPETKSRQISAASVADIITRPEILGTSLIGITSSSSAKVYNFNTLIEADTALINVQFAVDDSRLNAEHIEYQLLTEGVASSVPAPALEQKWIDSLVGVDAAGNSLPDLSLPFSRRFGIGIRPRQSMFIDRFSALKVVIEKINTVLTSEPFADTISFKNLNLIDPAPFFAPDFIVNTYADLLSITPSSSQPDILVLSDETANGLWCVYFWDSVRLEWFRRETQKFNTSRFWNNIDWWAEGFSNQSLVRQEINSIADSILSFVGVGDLLRVKQYGSGGWAVFERITTSSSSFLDQYRLVGRQNGTIQLSNLLYRNDLLGIGYDSIAPYDSLPYDYSIERELRNILTAVKEDIFIGAYRVEWNNLFFASVRYAFSEQQFIDWAFKTSFISAYHLVGVLDQPVNYRNDSLNAYEQYVNEVKPYRTTVRDYRSVYNVVDPGLVLVSDFDSPDADPTVVRTVDIDLVFDRVSQYLSTSTALRNDTFTVISNEDEFALTLVPLTDQFFTVLVNGEQLLSNEFSVTDNLVTVLIPLSAGDIVDISYTRSQQYYFAADRALSAGNTVAPATEELLPGITVDSVTITVERDGLNKFAIIKNANNNFRFSKVKDTAITLASDINANDADITVSDASTLPSIGILLINKELIFYTSKTSNTLQGIYRGFFNSSAVDTHATGSAVIDVGNAKSLRYGATTPYVEDLNVVYDQVLASDTASIQFSIPIIDNGDVTDIFEIFVDGLQISKSTRDIYSIVADGAVAVPAEFSASAATGLVTVEFTTTQTAGTEIKVYSKTEALPDSTSPASDIKYLADFTYNAYSRTFIEA